MTEMEKQLVSFARLLLTFVKSCKAGAAEGTEDVKRGFQSTLAELREFIADVVAGLVNASGEVNRAPWTLMHSWSVVLEVRTNHKHSSPTANRISGLCHDRDRPVALQACFGEESEKGTEQ